MSTDAATRTLLLDIARAAIDAKVLGTQFTAPVGDANVLREKRGVFVTLKRAGRLRGCVGRIDPDGPLSILLPEIAVLSATDDPRFPPVSAGELSGLEIELSLLTTPILITEPAQIVIGRHGLIVTARGRRGLLLPQVATERGWTASEFLAQTCVKASLGGSAWQDAGVRLHTFETEIIPG
jgi:uncharacterized protein